MYCSVMDAGQVCVFPDTKGNAWKALRSLKEHIRVVFWSVDANVPASVAVLLARRAVNWKPHARCAGSAMVTTRCCFTPGTYVCPPGNATLTLPLLAGLLVVPTWHPEAVQVPSSFGTPE